MGDPGGTQTEACDIHLRARLGCAKERRRSSAAGAPRRRRGDGRAREGLATGGADAEGTEHRVPRPTEIQGVSPIVEQEPSAFGHSPDHLVCAPERRSVFAPSDPAVAPAAKPASPPPNHDDIPIASSYFRRRAHPIVTGHRGPRLGHPHAKGSSSHPDSATRQSSWPHPLRPLSDLSGTLAQAQIVRGTLQASLRWV